MFSKPIFFCVFVVLVLVANAKSYQQQFQEPKTNLECDNILNDSAVIEDLFYAFGENRANRIINMVEILQKTGDMNCKTAKLVRGLIAMNMMKYNGFSRNQVGSHFYQPLV